MTATTTAFIPFSNFMRNLGTKQVDLSAANTFFAKLHHSGANLSTDSQLSTESSVLGTVAGAATSARRYLANVVFTAASGAPVSAFNWDSDALVWTASGTMTVKFAVFYMSLAADSALPVGFIQLVAADQEVTAGNTVTLTPNTYWFAMSG